MYEEVFAPLPDADAYLDRIGWSGPIKTDRDTLNALMLAHHCSVPFENLTVYDGDSNVSLYTADLFDKVVTRRRGGYCFELNAAFLALLRALGFNARTIIGRTVWGKPSRGFLGHRATLVEIDGKRLFCDVGFGGPGAELALDLDDPGLQHASRDSYFFTPSQFGETMLNRTVPGGSEELISFFTAECDARDFLPLNYYYSQCPESYFKSKRMVNLRTPDGFYAIDGSLLRIRTGDKTEERKITSAQEMTDVLKQYFEIDFKIERL